MNLNREWKLCFGGMLLRMITSLWKGETKGGSLPNTTKIKPAEQFLTQIPLSPTENQKKTVGFSGWEFTTEVIKDQYE
jgi:hypothetical protein